MKRRIISIITALALCLSLCPTWAFAAEADPALCRHHPAHTEECGYAAPTEGHDCGHEHTEDCYTADEAGGEVLDCQHTHDEDCGYVQADPGQPCGYECHICPIEALIAALPDEVTPDNADDVWGRLDEILVLYRELNEDEQEQIDLSRIYELQRALDGANAPYPVAESVDYREASWNNSEVVYADKIATCTPVENSADAVTWSESWYAVTGTVTIDQPITVTGDVSLILTDGCTLNASQGIVVTTGNSLTIYAQTNGTGTLTATGTVDGNNASAGIGGSTASLDSGTITIHGGVINATGGGISRVNSGAGIGGGGSSGNGGNSGTITIFGGVITSSSDAMDYITEGTYLGGAGIGGGGSSSDNGGTANSITIYGGDVTATSKGTQGGGAGIGGGAGAYTGGSGNITICGGTVRATGGCMDTGLGGAGIGGGGGGMNQQSGNGTVTISDGAVTAVGGNYAAGIGGGSGYQGSYGANITGGTGNVSITGGIVDAKGGAGNDEGDYAGAPIGNGGNATATATVNKTTGIVFENGAGTVCGNVTFNSSYAVPAGYSLHIPAGASLSGSGTLSGGGRFTADLSEDMISVPEDWHYTGENLTEKIKGASSLNGDMTICGKTFTADTTGWEQSVDKVSELEYTVKYTHTDGRTISKTVTIAKGQPSLSDAAAYKADGTTHASTFGVGETIIIKATPAFPANGAVMAAAFTEPTGEQMAVYYDNTQISAPSTVENGVHTMTVDTSNLPESALNKEIALTVKYIESGNASGADTEVKVTVTAAAKIEKGSSTTYVGALADAFTEGNSGATVTLLSEVDLGANYISIYNTFTLDLNGQTVKATGYGAFNISGGSITIQDSGTGGKIESSNITIEVNSGTLSIKSGTVSGFYGVRIISGTVNISGGAISGNETGLFVDAGGNITLSGGTYSGKRTAIMVDGDASVSLKDMLATGYAYHQNDIPVAKAEGLVGGYEAGEVPLDAKPAWLPGTVTVKECQHNGEGVCAYVHNENTSTHTETCLACGNAKDAETCSYDATTGRCVCGSTLAVTLPTDLKLTYDGTAKEPAVTVTLDGTVLTAEHYTVVYANNKDAGTATVTVNGTAPYTFTKELTFSIAKKPVTAVVTAADKTYDGTPNATMSATVTEGILSGDSITISGVTGTFVDENVGTDKTVTVNTTNASVTGTNAENYDVHYPETVTASITPIEVTLTFADQTIIYGETVTKATANVNGVKIVYSYTGTATGNDWPTNAGTYTVTAKVEATGNYGEATATAQLVISKAPLTVTGATIKTRPYKPTYHTAEVSGVTFTGLVNGETLALGQDYTAFGNYDDPNAGENKSATILVELKSSAKANNYNLTNSSVNATGTITKADSSITKAPAASEITYGQALSDSALTGGTGSVAGAFSWTAPATKPSAGTAQFEVTFTPTDTNYNTATVNVSVTVAKATPTITWGSATQTVDYTGSEAEITAPTVTLVNGESFSGTFSYSYIASGSAEYTSGLPVNAGTYTVKASIAEQGNYTTAESGIMTLTISKVNYTGEKAGSTSGKFGREKTYDLSDLLPEGYKLGTPTKTDTNNIFDGNPIVNGATLSYKLADNAEVGKTGTITVPVTESTNYNAFDLTITVTVTDKIVPTLTVNPITFAYTGSAVSASAIQGTATAEGKTIPGSWKFADGQALTNVADSGTKTVIFTPTDEAKADYASATGTVRVTITKATPSLTLAPSPATLPNGGTVTLTLSGLPTGGSATVTCSEASIAVTKGSGDTWTAELPAGGASYTFTATYAGDGNHNGATANCTVSVDKIRPALILTASPVSPLIGGGMVTLTLSGLPSGGSATVTCSGGITVTAGAGNTWTATLPNSTATYTFTASYAGNDSYHGANTTCTVETKEVVILPDQPTGENGEQLRLVMETGISEVPTGLQSIETLNTPEKLETAMKTEITQATPGIPEANTAVYDVVLMVSTDGGATWTKATKDNFPSGGLTITLPYPAGTNSSYRFTVVHMFTTSDFPGKNPGDTEIFTPNQVKNTAQGIQVVVTGLSPISVGWTAPATTPDTPSGNHGGGWSASTYAVTVEKSEHGKVTASRTNASSGSTVTLTVTPDSGYALDTLTVTDSRGNEIRLTAQGGGKYTFTMPGRAVTVKATFAPLPDDTQKPCDGGADCPSRSFTDLGSVGTWYHEAVDYVLRNGLMGGYGNGLFGPDNHLSRAQLAQILYNREGKPAVMGGSAFTDVAPGAWYAPAITWAAERGIVGGYGNGTFGPNDNITREQLAVMLWRYAGSPAATEKELHFTDADRASGYALEALRWAVENGVINGKGGGILAPQGLATRAQVAQMLMNFLKDE